MKQRAKVPFLFVGKNYEKQREQPVLLSETAAAGI